MTPQAIDSLAVDHRSLHAHLDRYIAGSASKQELFAIILVHLRGVRRIDTVIGYDAGEDAVRIVASIP